jgi:hypothetical protein
VLTSLILAAAATTGLPMVVAVEPAVITAYRSAELVIRGSGFGPDCRTLIGAGGRFVPVKHELVDGSEIHVRLAAGYGPDPARREIVVECGPGRRSRPFPIEVVRRAEETLDDPSPAPAEQQAVDVGAVKVTGVDPETIVAGEIVTLTIMGLGFSDGAEVEIYANRNAGTSRTPIYDMLRFPAEVASDTVLLVDLDRGFAPSPRLRRLTVVNPDGGASAPVYLEIQRRMP